MAAALHRGHLDIAELLYRAGADLGIRNNSNMTLLHAASLRRSADVVRWLFDHGVGENPQQDSDETPLHLAGGDRHRWHGITVNEADDAQITPLHLAAEGGLFEIVQELLIQGADVTAKDRTHRTPLHLASHHWASAKLSPS
jgi:ankyrin repeat protein